MNEGILIELFLLAHLSTLKHKVSQLQNFEISHTLLHRRIFESKVYFRTRTTFFYYYYFLSIKLRENRIRVQNGCAISR